MLTCAACGHESPHGFRFCPSCGAALAEPEARREVRKTVTVVFCDVTGSTALGERLDPEALRRTMGRYFDEIRMIVERHGGTVEKFIGDAVMAVFGIPVSHEDDALRAVRSVAEIRERLGALGEELSVALSFRTGVNTGEVVAGEGETLVTGDAVNVAARLEQAAAAGEILIGAGTLALVRGAVTFEEVEALELKGKREPVPAFRLVTVDAAAEAFARHLDAPLVGRRQELARLRADFDAAVSERACHLFTLLGPAGVGKSRLVVELLVGTAGRADVLHSRCLHYGEDITYWPLVEILIAIGVEPGEVMGSSPAETQLSFRKLLERRAAERPQIVLLDDIQWAEPVFLDLIEHIADWSRDAPIFLLCAARPELLEERPAWGGGKLNATTVLLEPLTGADCEALIAELPGGAGLSSEVRERILRAADGNPLFIEEMLALVAEDGSGAEVVVPPTIQALLQARLDRLGAEERDVIGRGSVEGQVFHRGVVQELAPEAGRESVPTHLLALVRKDVIRPDQATFADDDAFRFRHLLIRDAAYDALPKETRADLHERFAEWLEAHGGLVELDEIAGYHLEQAHRNRAELDPADPRLEPLARRAASRLSVAARGAMARGDAAASVGLLERGVAMLPAGDPDRLDGLIELAEPLLGTEGRDRAGGIVEELAAAPDRRYRAYAHVVRNLVGAYAGSDLGVAGYKAGIDAARSVFTELGDERGLALADQGEWWLNWTACRAEESYELAVRASAHADRAGDPALAARFRMSALFALTLGPTAVDEVVAAAETMLVGARGPIESAMVRRHLGKALAIRGDTAAGREHVIFAIETFREAGLLVMAGAGSMQAWFVELQAGDLDAAERALHIGHAELDRLGDRAYLPTVAALLADTLARHGADEDALRWCDRVRETTSPSDLVNIVLADSLEGTLLARRGQLEEGERLVRSGVALADTIDFWDHRARAYELFAETLELAGKPTEALEAVAVATAIYEAKGDVPGAGRARELAESLALRGAP